jgi:hypothetical protein
MSFQITRDERSLEFAIKTTEKVASFHGTAFIPNSCAVKIFKGQIVSIMLDQLDENGYGLDDPAGPEGAELNVGYGGDELLQPGELPEIVQQALAAIKLAASEVA